MEYHLECTWNGKRVLSADCTAALASDIMRGLLVENFAGRSRLKGLVALPPLGTIKALPVGGGTEASNKDETGRAYCLLTRKVAADA